MIGGATQICAEAVLNALLNNAALGAPATWYVGGLTQLPDANGENYVESAESRTAVTANTTNFPAWAAGVVRNATAINYAAFAGTEIWLGVGLFDASTAGNLWMWVQFTSSRTILSGETFGCPAASLPFTLGMCTLGGLTQVAAEAVLNALLNAAALGEPATWYVGLVTTLWDADGASYVESAEDRISKTQNDTNFPVWAAGLVRNGTAVEYPAFAGAETILGAGLWDDSAAGDLWLAFEYVEAVEVAEDAAHTIPISGMSFSMGVCAE